MENKLYLIKSGDGNFIEETETIIGVTGGNVGIGTTNPSNLLHIHASGNNASGLIIEDDARRLQLGRDMIEARSGDGTTVQNLYIQPNGNTAFATNVGKVGIGTTNPSDRLDVIGRTMINRNAENTQFIGTDHTYLAFYPRTIASGRKAFLGYNAAETTNFTIMNEDAGDVVIGTNSSEAIRVDSNGITKINRNGENTQFIGTDHTYLAFYPRTIASGRKAILGYNAGETTNFTVMNEDAGDVVIGTNSSEAIRVDSNGNVGIGTTNPSHTLDVNGTIGLNVLDTGYGYIGFQIGGDAYTGPKIKATSGNSLFFAADDDDTKNLIINSSGNVGIGTNNPVQALEISGANRNIITRDGNIVAGRGMRAGYQTTFPAIVVAVEASGDDGTKKWEWYNNANTSGNNHFSTYERTSGNQGYRFTIQEGGNIGIGTTNPKSELNVTANNSGQGAILTLENSDTSITRDDIIGQIDFYTNDTSVNGIGAKVNIKGIAESEAGTLTALTFGTSDSTSNTGIERMRIDYRGNVGIGTTSPSAQLHIKASSLSQEGLIVENSLGHQTAHIGHLADGASYLKLADSTGQNHALIRNNGGNYLAVGGGNVGIGTTNPSEKLEIYEDAPEVWLTSSNTGGHTYALKSTSIGSFWLGRPTGENTLNTSEVDFSIDDGNVGIGTTNPEIKLTVDAGIIDIPALFKSDDGGSYISFMDNSTTNDHQVLVGAVGNDLVFQAGSDPWMYIKESGNVGIGTASPAAKLHIENGDLRIEKDTKATIGFKAHTSDSTSTALAFRDTNAGIDRMLIDSIGNVGIGTTSPDGRLHVSGGAILAERSIKAGYGTDQSASVVGVAAYDADTPNGEANPHIHEWELYANGTEKTFGIYDRTESEYRFIVDYSGNIGIGTNNPNYNLDIITTGDLTDTVDSKFRLYHKDGVYNPRFTIGHNASGTILEHLYSTTSGKDMIFKNGSHIMVLDDNGNVGIGTTNSTKRLTVDAGIIDISAVFTSDDLGSYIAFMDNSTTNDHQVLVGAVGNDLVFQAGSDAWMYIKESGNVGIGTSNPTHQLQLSTDSAAKPSTNTWTISSDSRAKENIELANLDVCYDNIKNIPLKRYTWSSEFYNEEQVKDRSKIGWIAQDVESVFPKAVDTHEVKYAQKYEEQVIPAVEEVLDEEGNVIQEAQEERVEKVLIDEKIIEDFKSLNADQLYASMYGAIQKLMQKVETLEQEVSDLKGS